MVLYKSLSSHLTNATLGRLALHCIKMCSICQKEEMAFAISSFCLPVGLEPQVRVWPKLPCAAGGRCSRAAWCAAVGVQRSPAGGKAHTGHRNRTPAPEKNGNRDTITVLFSYIRLRRVILAAPVIFASQVILPYGQFGRRI